MYPTLLLIGLLGITSTVIMNDIISWPYH